MIEERERLGFGQAEFAALAGLTDRSQRMYEKGERQPDTKYLLAIAGAGADIVYILTGQRLDLSGRTLTVEEASLLDNYRAADERGRAAARAVLSTLAEPAPYRADKASGE